MGTDDLYQQAIEFYSDFAVRNPRVCFLELEKVGWSWKGRAVLVPLNLIGGFIVARGKNTKSTPAREKATWNTTFVDIPMAGHSWDDISANWDTPEAVWDDFAELLENGYRVGFSYNPQNDAFIASCTCKNDEDTNNGMTFTGFAGTWFEALQVILFKHLVIARRNWKVGAVSSDKPKFG